MFQTPLRGLQVKGEGTRRFSPRLLGKIWWLVGCFFFD